MHPHSRIIISLVVTILICQAVFVVASTGLRKYNTHKVSRLTELFLNNTKYDVVFLGSSRTHTTINPKIIDSICGVNSYNAGVEGGNLYEFKLTFDGYLVNHPAPKLLVLTLDIGSFNLNRKIYNYIQYLSFTQNPVIKQALIENGHNTTFFKLIPFIELTVYDDYTRGNILKGLSGVTDIPESDFQYKGYLSNTMNYITSQDTSKIIPTKQAKISKESLNLLQSIIDTCKTRNTKLIFTYAPEYRHRIQDTYTNKLNMFNLIDSVANHSNIPFLRHDRLKMCKNQKLFANAGHVNKLGADFYSNILGQDLKLIFSKLLFY